MKRTIAAAFILLLAQFLLPVLLFGTKAQTLPPLPRPTGSNPSDSSRPVRLLHPDGAVEPLTLSDYLWGVVAAEMPASFEPEALKAQAVAARTYWAAADPDKHEGADICGDSGCCQAYISPAEAAANWGDRAQEYTLRIAGAVSATDRLIAVYGDKPIQAVYFSSAPGRTVDAVAVWGREVPYLVSVTSPEGDEVPNWRTELSLSAETLRRLVLDSYPEADLSGPCEKWLTDLNREPSGTVSSALLGGVQLTGGQLRRLLGLRSACFTLSVAGEQFNFQTTGYGHGVGMSQYGANAMARQGSDFREILSWYYTGTQLKQLD